jgi:hypothetical protein
MLFWLGETLMDFPPFHATLGFLRDIDPKMMRKCVKKFLSSHKELADDTLMIVTPTTCTVEKAAPIKHKSLRQQFDQLVPDEAEVKYLLDEDYKPRK